MGFWPPAPGLRTPPVTSTGNVREAVVTVLKVNIKAAVNWLMSISRIPTNLQSDRLSYNV